MYVEPWHADIMAFLDLRKNHGKEEMRARDLFYAMWMNDLFMQRVEKDEMWSLMCPNECKGLTEAYAEDFTELYEKYESEGKYRKRVKARDVWSAICDSQIETGTPYMLYKDSINVKSNQKNLGTIKSSNLCITGDQRVVSNYGYLTAKELSEKNTDLVLFDGNKAVKSSPMLLRAENEDVYMIRLENGMEHKVTSYHGIPILNGKNKIIRKECKDVSIGDKIPVQTKKGLFGDKEMSNEAYLLGLYQSDGTQSRNSIHLDIWENDFDLINDIENRLSSLYQQYSYNPRYANKGGKFLEANTGQSDVRKKRLTTDFLKKDLNFEKGYVPSWIWESTESTIWSYVKGLLEADGSVSVSKSKGCPIQIAYFDINYDFLKELQLLFQNLGLQTSIRVMREEGKRSMPNGKGGHKFYKCKKSYRLLIGNKNDALEIERNTNFLSRKGIKIEDRLYRDNSKKSYKVESITYIGKEDVYCPTVYTEEHIFIAQGMKTFNCAEIVEYTEHDSEIAVCNLASIALPKFIRGTKNLKFDHKKLYDVAYQATINLNKVIDVTYYPIDKAKNSNNKHRPIGLGVQGLADVFFMFDIPYGSDEAKKLNKEIAETIYFASLTASCELAKKDGAYESYEGSPISKGVFQFDMWNVKPSDRWNWEELKDEIKKHGVRNSLNCAQMPTGSTSSILGNEASTEAQTSNMYTRRILAGEFICINKHLVKKLCELGLWNDSMRNKIIINNGSVQGIDEIPVNLQEVYKTAYEMSQKDVIDIHRERAPFVDQTQSMNIWMTKPSSAKLTSMHFYGWGGGVTKDITIDRINTELSDEAYSLNEELKKSDTSTQRENEIKQRLAQIESKRLDIEKWSKYGATPEKALKTGSYYLRSKAAADAQKFTVSVEEEKAEKQKKVEKNTDEMSLKELLEHAKNNENDDDDDCLMCSG